MNADVATEAPKRPTRNQGPLATFKQLQEAVRDECRVRQVDIPGGFNIEAESNAYRPEVGGPLRLTYSYATRRLAATRQPAPSEPERPKRISQAAGIAFISELASLIDSSGPAREPESLQVVRWKAVVGWEGLYEVSDQGRVRSLRRRTASGPKGGFILRAPTDDSGYPQVSLHDSGRRRFARVHKLVMEAFVGPCPPEMEIRHLNGIRLDAKLENLAYGSRSENVLDTIAHGTNSNANKTCCPKNHPYDNANTYIKPNGGRDCRACVREAGRRYRERKKGARSANQLGAARPDHSWVPSPRTGA